MTVYLVQYHSNAWGDQESSDDILGIYSTEEKANERLEEYEKSGHVWDDDSLFVREFELDEKVTTFEEDMERLCE